MPQSCHISTCDLISIAACLCCNQYLCRDHFVQHDSLLRSKLNLFTEKINQLSNQIETFDINKITNDFILKLDKWRFDSYQIIENFYDKKCQELYHYIQNLLNKQQEKIIQLGLKLAKMINIQQTTDNNLKLLTSNIQNLQEQINQIKHILIELDIQSFALEDNLININISNPYQFDLSILSCPYQIIDRTPLSSDAIASNDQYLLLHQNSNLYLIDKNLFVIYEKKWSHDWIRDMCWSQTLNSFFLITFDDVYLVEQDTLIIKHIKTIKGRCWQSCTCSNTCLYLSKDKWNSSIEEFCLKPSIEFIKHRERFEITNQKQRIDNIQYNNETLALIINDRSKQNIFIELRSITTFNRLWLYQFNIEYSERKLQCCLLTCNAWIVADWGTSSIFHITEDGHMKKMIKYKDEIHYVNLFRTNKLIISTNDSINFHQL